MLSFLFFELTLDILFNLQQKAVKLFKNNFLKVYYKNTV